MRTTIIRNSLWMFVLSTAAALNPVSASTERSLSVDSINVNSEGAAKSVAGTVMVRNLRRQTVLITPQIANPRFQVRSSSMKSVTAAPMQSVSVPFQATISSDGKHHVIVNLLISSENGDELGDQPVDVNFQVADGHYVRKDYEQLFVPNIGQTATPGLTPQVRQITRSAMPTLMGPVPPEPPPVEAPHSGTPMSPFTPVTPVMPNNPQQRTDVSTPGRPDVQPVLPPFQLQIRPGTEDGNFERVMPNGLPRPPAAKAQKSSSSGLLQRIARAATRLLPISSALALSKDGKFEPGDTPKDYPTKNYSFSGKFSYVGQDDKSHPAMGWYVKLVTQVNGTERELAGTYIGADGNWSVKYDDHSSGGLSNLSVCYRVGGYYLLPMNQQGQEYWFCDANITPVPSSLNVGHHWVEMSDSGMHSQLAGLGDVYNWAMLYQQWLEGRNQIKVTRDQPIRLYFPNTWTDCLPPHSGPIVPWSCASQGSDTQPAEIYLTSAHTSRRVIQHELSHQLNYEHWASIPPGNGGTHFEDLCYNNGLALVEGFADAVPELFMQSMYSLFNIQPGMESVATSVCSGPTNETRVAATFWDLADRHQDGTDNLYFYNPANVIRTYLDGGVKNGMVDLLPSFIGAANPEHADAVRNVFRNNTIIP